MSTALVQQQVAKCSVQRAFFTRKPVAARAARVCAMAQLDQDELKKQVGGPPPPPRPARRRRLRLPASRRPRQPRRASPGVPELSSCSFPPPSQAAWKAVEYVKSGMVVGLGTGSTAAFAVDRIGSLLKSGELTDIVGVPTSVRTYEQAKSEARLLAFWPAAGAPEQRGWDAEQRSASATRGQQRLPPALRAWAQRQAQGRGPAP